MRNSNCNCINGKQCTYCFLGPKMKARKAIHDDILMRGAGVGLGPLSQDDTDYEAVMIDAMREFNDMSHIDQDEAKVIQVCFKSKQRLN
jgi:hypothetical protein